MTTELKTGLAVAAAVLTAITAVIKLLQAGGWDPTARLRDSAAAIRLSLRTNLQVPAGLAMLTACVLALLAVLTNGTVAAIGCLVSSAMIGTAVLVRRPSVLTPRGKWLLGVAVDRRIVLAGTANVSHRTPVGLPPREAVHIDNVSAPVALAKSVDASVDVVAGVVATVLAGHAGKGHRFTSIGISIPGEVNREGKGLSSAPSGLTFAEGDFATVLAKRLWRNQGEALKQIFRIRTPEELAACIWIDNDARCTARALASSYRNEASWENYAYVLIGEGVGAGLVVARKPYFGTSLVAGEIGHTCVHLYTPHLGKHGVIGEEFDSAVLPDCACVTQDNRALPSSERWVHWEQLVGSAGLLRLARMVNELEFDRAKRIFDPSISSGEFGAEHLPILAALAAQPEQTSWPDGIDSARWGLCDEPKAPLPVELDDAMRHYLDQLFGRYAQYLAVGIANLVNVMNLDHVRIGGPIAQRLRLIPNFAHAVQALVQDSYALRSTGQGVGKEIRFVEGDETWRGAALVAWDEEYFRRVSASVP